MHMNRIRIHIFFLIVILAGGIQAQNPRVGLHRPTGGLCSRIFYSGILPYQTRWKHGRI